MSHHICQDLNKPSIIVTEFVDCDISLDVVTYLSQVVCQVIGCKCGGEAPDEAESQEANWVFVANSHHHSTSGQHKCSGSRCFTSGSLKCHYNQPLGYVAYLETEMLEEMAFIIVAH